jgi:hypothetical protein
VFAKFYSLINKERGKGKIEKKKLAKIGRERKTYALLSITISRELVRALKGQLEMRRLSLSVLAG